MKKLVPFAYAQNVYDINPDFFIKLNLKYIFLDLDNTLDTHKDKVPSERAKNLIKTIKSINIEPIIISNNKKIRVSQYADELGVNYLYRARKPFKGKVNKFISENNISKEDVILVGDQLMTDVRCASRVGIRCILTEKLWPNDQFVTKFLRWLDVIKRKKLKNSGLLIDWREVYGRIK